MTAAATSFGVYIIENTVNGACYVGCTAKPFRQRWSAHRSLLARGEHHASRLQNDWNAHGSASFQFRALEEIDSPLDILAREEYWIRQLRPSYNSKYAYRPGRPTKKSTRVELRLNADDPATTQLEEEAEIRGISIQEYIISLLEVRYQTQEEVS